MARGRASSGWRAKDADAGSGEIGKTSVTGCGPARRSAERGVAGEARRRE